MAMYPVLKSLQLKPLSKEQHAALRRFANGSTKQNIAEYYDQPQGLFHWFEQLGFIGWNGVRLRMTRAGVVALALADGKPVPLSDSQRLVLEQARLATDAKVPFFAPSETTGTRELSVEIRRQLEELGFLTRRDGSPNGPAVDGYIYLEITYAGRAALQRVIEQDAEHAEHPLAEPQWEAGKHDWRDGFHCAICWASREREGDGWVPTLVPCVPRLVEQVSGFYTTHEAARKLGISRSVFTNRLRTRGLVPAAISPNNVYYWRWDQLDAIAEDDKQRNERMERERHSGDASSVAARLYRLVTTRIKNGRPAAADELEELRRDLSEMVVRLRLA
jgi:hypothetical protein